MISIKIDVTKIKKERLYKGAKGTYLDAVLIPTPNSEYGDYMIVESISKEEREAGNKGTILRNAKNIVKRDALAEPTAQDFQMDGPDDLPF